MIFFLFSSLDIIHPNGTKFSTLLSEEALSIFPDFNSNTKTFSYNNKQFSYSCSCPIFEKNRTQKISSFLVIACLIVQTTFFYPTFTPSHEEHFQQFKQEHIGKTFQIDSLTFSVGTMPFEGDPYPLFIEQGDHQDYINSNSCRPEKSNFFSSLDNLLNKNLPPCCLPQLQEGLLKEEDELNELILFLSQE